jgi:hypothetical protein
MKSDHALLVRIIIALCTSTVFQPDEYFQALEPAYHLVFGYGHLTWEWLAPQPIRSILYPSLNVPLYSLVKFTGWDWLLVRHIRINLLIYLASNLGPRAQTSTWVSGCHDRHLAW